MLGMDAGLGVAGLSALSAVRLFTASITPKRVRVVTDIDDTVKSSGNKVSRVGTAVYVPAYVSSSMSCIFARVWCPRGCSVRVRSGPSRASYILVLLCTAVVPTSKRNANYMKSLRQYNVGVHVRVAVSMVCMYHVGVGSSPHQREMTQ